MFEIIKTEKDPLKPWNDAAIDSWNNILEIYAYKKPGWENINPEIYQALEKQIKHA